MRMNKREWRRIREFMLRHIDTPKIILEQNSGGGIGRNTTVEAIYKKGQGKNEKRDVTDYGCW